MLIKHLTEKPKQISPFQSPAVMCCFVFDEHNACCLRLLLHLLSTAEYAIHEKCYMNSITTVITDEIFTLLIFAFYQLTVNIPLRYLP